MSELVELVLEDAKDRMAKAVHHTRNEFSSVRTGRASPTLVERLNAEAYGVTMSVLELASISVPEARQLMITPHDPMNLEAIERAIRVSDLAMMAERFDSTSRHSPKNVGKSW